MLFKPFLWGAFAVALLFIPDAFADMGRVTVHAQGVEVGESAQKAVILHNGQNEVLILGTELAAKKKTPIIRFIPFPSEPKVSLAPAGAFDKLAGIVAKYGLKFIHVFHSKSPGGGDVKADGVVVKFAAKLGAHDMTVIEVKNAVMFRAWVNKYFRSKKLPQAKSYPAEEDIVADYVARGFKFFALDYVEVTEETRFIDPVVYQFKSEKLYYPLKDTNSFGGKGEIDLFIVAPVTLCEPGSAMFFTEGDKAVTPQGNVFGACLNLKVQASTSALLVPVEKDLEAVYPGAGAFFAGKPMFLQAIRYDGEYKFDDDVLVPLVGMAKALGGPRQEDYNDGLFARPQFGEPAPACKLKPETGSCKALFDSYYFDAKSGTCKQATWGGCGGVVPFETLKDCEDACKPK